MNSLDRYMKVVGVDPTSWYGLERSTRRELRRWRKRTYFDAATDTPRSVADFQAMTPEQRGFRKAFLRFKAYCRKEALD